MNPDDWRHRANCVDADPEAFFRDDTIGPGDKEATADAIRICRSCPVRSECLRWALDNYAHHGVFGGLTGAQRIALRRQQRRKENAQ